MKNHSNSLPRTALITGGSQGLGRALAHALGRRGTALALVARHQAALDRSVDELRRQGITAHAICADVGERDAATLIAGQAHADLGHVDLLVHNASTLGPTPMPILADLDGEDFERVLQVNVLGPHRLTRAIAASMLLAQRGTVLSISSDAAVEAYANWGAYSATKAALDHLTRIWASEAEGSGLRFLSIDPGEMNTAMHAAAMPDADPDALLDPAAVAARILDILDAPARAPSGARIAASQWEQEQ